MPVLPATAGTPGTARDAASTLLSLRAGGFELMALGPGRFFGDHIGEFLAGFRIPAGLLVSLLGEHPRSGRQRRAEGVVVCAEVGPQLDGSPEVVVGGIDVARSRCCGARQELSATKTAGTPGRWASA